MSLRIPVCAAVVLVALPVTARAQLRGPGSEYPVQEDYRLRLEYRSFRPALSGEIQKGNADEVGTLIDPKKDLVFQDQSTFEVRGTIQLHRGQKIRLSYTKLDYRGDTGEVGARKNFTFRNTHYERFDRVASTMKGAYYSALFEWDLVKSAHGYLGALVGAKALDVDWTLVDVTQNARELDTLRTPLPVLGATTRLYSGRVSFEGELAGLSIGGRGTAYEAEGSLRLHVSDRLAALGGYRRLSVHGQDGRDHGKLMLGGWQFGLELSL